MTDHDRPDDLAMMDGFLFQTDLDQVRGQLFVSLVFGHCHVLTQPAHINQWHINYFP